MAWNASFLQQSLEGQPKLPEAVSERPGGGQSSSHLSLTLAHILLALWAWFANLTQVVNLLQSPKLRRQPRSLLMVSISVSDLLVAGFLCPLYTDSLVRGPWRHSPLLCSLYEVVFFMQVCVSSLAVLVLNVERFYFLLAPRLLQGPTQCHLKALLTSLPWLVSIIVVIPLFICGARTTMEHVPGLHHHTCVVDWDRTLHTVTAFITFLAPSFLLLATAVMVLLLYVISTVRANEIPDMTASSVHLGAQWPQFQSENSVMSWGDSGRHRHCSGLQELDTKTKRECVMAVCISSFLTVGLQSPFFTLLLLQQFCQQPQASLLPDASGLHQSWTNSGSVSKSAGCNFSDAAWTTCMMLGMAKPGLLPLVWLVYSDIRAGLSLKAWRSCAKSLPRSSAVREECVDPELACSSLPSLVSQGTVL